MEEEVGELTEEEINKANSQSQNSKIQAHSSESRLNMGKNDVLEHELKIKLINASGDEKELIIKYSE